MHTRLLWLISVAVVPVSMLAAQTTPAAPRSGSPGVTRIISLIPAVTEMLFAIGAGSQVVAVSSFDRFPPQVQALPRVGALLDPDLERILALRPDLVIVYGTQTELRRQLERAGIPLFVYKHAGVADITSTLRQVGARVGRGEEGERLAVAIEDALNKIKRRVAGQPRPRTLLVLGRETGALRGIFASGGYGFLHDMLEIAGGANVFADVERESLQATSELILARRPDVILELRGSSDTPLNLRVERAAWQALSSVPAVRLNRVYWIEDDRVVNPGPRVAEGTELIARVLHPDSFE
ncbi:MAG: ABC transporter substrate-binding protein [Vicinamibacterales bacterium]